MKLIYMDDATKTQLLQEILSKATEQLNNRAVDKISINKTVSDLLPKPTEKAIIDFDPMAWLQMRVMVEKSKEECAWHGTVEANEERTHFRITKLLPYPQRIAGMTVEDDDPKYEQWHQALDNDTYNSLRMQGHSHVSAGASPSGRDTATYQNYLNALSNDGYYIFMITNNRGDSWFNIYDLQNNRIWEQADIIMTIGDMDLNKWYTAMSETFYAKRPTVVTNSLYEKANTRSTTTTTTASRGKQTTIQQQNLTKKELDAFYAASGDSEEDRLAVNRFLMREEYERHLYNGR